MSKEMVINTVNNGIGFWGALTILFITLKLLNQITWSWWWVLAPIWMPITIVLIFIAIIGGLVFFKWKR